MKHAVMIVTLLLAGGALAGVDPDPNSLGIYFDEGATYTIQLTPELYQPNSAYLILCNPTTDGVLGWECTIGFTADGGGFSSVTVWAPRGSFVNADTPPGFAVGLASPLPSSAEIVLMDITYFYTGGICWFNLGPGTVPSIEGHMTFLDGADVGNILVMDPMSGDFDIPVGCIGTTAWPCITDVEESTWGAVRTLYR